MIKFLIISISILVAILLSLIGYSYYFHSGFELARLLYMALPTVIIYLTLISSSSYKLNIFSLLAVTCTVSGFIFSVLHQFLRIYKELYYYTPWPELLCSVIILILFALAVKNQAFTKWQLSSQVNRLRLKPHLRTWLGYTFILMLMKLLDVVLGLNDTDYQFITLVLNITFTLWIYAFFPVILLVCLLVLVSKRLSQPRES